MKKILLSMTLAAALAVPLHQAAAVVPPPAVPPACLAIPGACGIGAHLLGGSLLPAVGWTLLPTALFTLGALNVDPWTPVFGKKHVFYEYPTGKNGAPSKVEYVPSQDMPRPIAAHAPVNQTPYHVMSQYGTDSIRSD